MPVLSKASSSCEQRASQGHTSDIGGSLVQQLELEEAEAATSNKRRRLRRRSTEEAVNKRIRDHFPGWTAPQTHMRLVEGKSLWNTIRDDLKAIEGEKAPAMGRKYYERLRDMYGGNDTPHKKLAPRNENDPVDPSLLEALSSLLRHRRSCQEMHDWCSVVASVNQKCYVALCRQVMQMTPSNADLCGVIVSIMKMVARLGLHKEFVEETSFMATVFDQAALRSIEAFKRAGQGARAWWANNREWALLVLPQEETERCLEESEDWGRVAPQLQRVCDGSESGRRLFGRAMASLEISRLTSLIRETVGELAHQDITMETLEKNKEDFLKRVKHMGVDATRSTSKRQVQFEYRGIACVAMAGSLMEEYKIYLEAHIRSEAVDCGVVKPLWAEADLVGRRVAGLSNVEEQAVVGTVLVRRVLSEALEDGDATASNIQRVLAEKAPFLAQADRYFSKVEVPFFQSFVHSGGMDILQKRVLACVPGPGLALSLTESDALFKALGKSKLLHYCGPSGQSIFNASHGFVQSMLVGRPPELASVSDSPFLLQLKLALARFCTSSPAASASSRAPPLVGVAALAAHWEALQAKVQAKADLTLVDFKTVQTFEWLLSAQQKEELKQMVNNTVAQHTRLMSTRTSEAAPTKKTKTPKKSVDAAKSLAASLFV